MINQFLTFLKLNKKNPYFACAIIFLNGVVLYTLLRHSHLDWVKDALFVFWDVGSTCVAFIIGFAIKEKK